MPMNGGTTEGCPLIVVLFCTAAVVALQCRATVSPLDESSGQRHNREVSFCTDLEPCGASILLPQTCRAPAPCVAERFRPAGVHLIQRTSILWPHGTARQPTKQELEDAEDAPSNGTYFTQPARTRHNQTDARTKARSFHREPELGLWSASLLAVARGGAAQFQGLLADSWEVRRGVTINVVAGTVVLLLLIFLLVIVLLMQSRFIGDKVREGIEHYDREYLGVDVTFGNVQVASLTGKISIKNMLVFNPPGYKSTYLLKVGAVDVLIDTRQLALGCFTFDKLTLQRIIIRDVEIVYEESWTSSNVHDLINFLEYGNFSGNDKTPVAQPPPPVQPESTTTVHGSAQGKTAEGDQWLTLHELRVEQTQVKLASHTFKDAGVHLQIADVVYADFDKELGGYVVDDVIKFVLKSILSTAAHQLASPFSGLGGSKTGSSRRLGCC